MQMKKLPKKLKQSQLWVKNDNTYWIKLWSSKSHLGIVDSNSYHIISTGYMLQNTRATTK